MSEWDDLPERMRSAKRWLVYKAIATGDSKPRKVPFYVSGEPRSGALDSPEDMAKLATFEDALAALGSGRYSGIGFALGPDGTGNHWQGIDYDKLSARPHLAMMCDDLPGYTERSPSGDGRHAIGYGRPFAALSSNESGIEAYSSGRYFTVTADCAGIGDLVDLFDYVVEVLAPIHGRSAVHHAPAAQAAIAHASPETIFDLRSALNSLSADDYETWIAVGQALKDIGATGRELWLTWSQSSDKWQAKDAKKWDTFNPSRTGYQAIFARAQAQGWVNPRSGGANRAQAAQTAQAPRVSAGTLRLLPPCDGKREKPVGAGFVLEPIIPRRVVTLFGGHGGTGKTMCALTMAAHAACGVPWGPYTLKRPQKCVFLSFEDGADIIEYRLDCIIEHYDLPRDMVAEYLAVYDGSEVDAALVSESRFRLLEILPMMEQVRDACAGASAVFIDNASDTFDGDENNRRHVRTFMRELTQIAKANNAGVVLLAHIDKSAAKYGAANNSYSGSTAWHNSARSRIALIDTGEGLELRHEKFNLSEQAPVVKLMRAGKGVPVPQTPEQVAFAQSMATQTDAGAVLEAIKGSIAAGFVVPYVFDGRREYSAYGALETRLPDQLAESNKRVRSAIESMVLDGRLIVVEYVNSARKKREKVVPSEAGK